MALFKLVTAKSHSPAFMYVFPNIDSNAAVGLLCTASSSTAIAWELIAHNNYSWIKTILSVKKPWDLRIL